MLIFFHIGNFRSHWKISRYAAHFYCLTWPIYLHVDHRCDAGRALLHSVFTVRTIQRHKSYLSSLNENRSAAAWSLFCGFNAAITRHVVHMINWREKGRERDRTAAEGWNCSIKRTNATKWMLSFSRSRSGAWRICRLKIYQHFGVWRHGRLAATHLLALEDKQSM